MRTKKQRERERERWGALYSLKNKYRQQDKSNQRGVYIPHPHVHTWHLELHNRLNHDGK
jgi:hypothetical protein